MSGIRLKGRNVYDDENIKATLCDFELPKIDIKTLKDECDVLVKCRLMKDSMFGLCLTNSEYHNIVAVLPKQEKKEEKSCAHKLILVDKEFRRDTGYEEILERYECELCGGKFGKLSSPLVKPIEPKKEIDWEGLKVQEAVFNNETIESQKSKYNRLVDIVRELKESKNG